MAEKEQYSEQALPEGCDLAIAAEAFYIVNMVLAPGLGFMMLAALYPYCKRKRPPAIALGDKVSSWQVAQLTLPSALNRLSW